MQDFLIDPLDSARLMLLPCTRLCSVPALGRVRGSMWVFLGHSTKTEKSAAADWGRRRGGAALELRSPSSPLPCVNHSATPALKFDDYTMESLVQRLQDDMHYSQPTVKCITMWEFVGALKYWASYRSLTSCISLPLILNPITHNYYRHH